MKGRTFKGCLYEADVDADGNLTSNWSYFGEAYPLSVQMTKEIVPIYGRTCETDGKVIGSKERTGDSGGSLTLFDYTSKNVAKALNGAVSTRAVSASTLTAEPVKVGKYGEFVDIGTEDLTDVVIQDASDTTTHAINVDYQLNATLGLLAPVKGGAVAENSTLHVSGAGAANTDQRVTIGAGASMKKAIKGKLIDDFDGTVHKVFLRMVRMTLTNEVVLVSAPDTDREQIDFALSPEIPNGQSDYGYIDGLPI